MNSIPVCCIVKSCSPLYRSLFCYEVWSGGSECVCVCTGKYRYSVIVYLFCGVCIYLNETIHQWIPLNVYILCMSFYIYIVLQTLSCTGGGQAGFRTGSWCFARSYVCMCGLTVRYWYISEEDKMLSLALSVCEDMIVFNCLFVMWSVENWWSVSCYP